MTREGAVQLAKKPVSWVQVIPVIITLLSLIVAQFAHTSHENTQQAVHETKQTIQIETLRSHLKEAGRDIELLEIAVDSTLKNHLTSIRTIQLDIREIRTILQIRASARASQLGSREQ